MIQLYGANDKHIASGGIVDRIRRGKGNFRTRFEDPGGVSFL